MESSSIKRRLTAILAADAVNYSRHMGEDEEGTLRQLAAHRAVIDRIIGAHEGRIVGTAGDSVLAEFSSPVEAVRCAVEIQEGVHTRNETLPIAQRLDFRIGVNLGDVMVDGADILGDGVNVAARLESIAEPGGICISSSVYDQVAGKLSLGFFDMGEQSLKNIARPIRVYQFDRLGAGGASRRAQARRRKTGLVAGIFAALVVAGVGAWQTGLLTRHVEPKSIAPSVALPAIPAPPPASEEMKLKLQIAEAERAKAEAELARSRSELEAARQRTASRSPAPEGKGASPAPAQPSGDAAPPVAPMPALAAPTTAGPPAIAQSDHGTATRECAASEDQRAFADRQLPVRVEGGEIIVERGVSAEPGYMLLRGRPTADGHLTLVGTAVSIGKRNYGKEMTIFFSGAYTNGAYMLSGRTGGRNCTMTVRLAARP
jgi:class 3 adenylate cyclase